MEPDIRGFLPQSLVDYPDNIASVLFFAGCNMRCPFCYNQELVKTPEKYTRLKPEWILHELERRKNFIDSVVLSGGEPTLYNLETLIEKIKAIGLLVKLDTNGMNPNALEKLLPLIDYVAMDVKAAKQRYKDAAGTELDLKKIEQSITLIKNSGMDYEFRSTIVPAFVPEEDFEELIALVSGAQKYFIQQYRPIKQAGMLSNAYPPETLQKLAEKAKPLVKHVAVRGV